MKIKSSTDNQKLITSTDSKCVTQSDTRRARNNISFILQFVILLVFINVILTTLAFFVQFRYFESKNNEFELRLNSLISDQGSQVQVRIKRQDDSENTTSTNELEFLNENAFGSSYTEEQVFIFLSIILYWFSINRFFVESWIY